MNVLYISGPHGGGKSTLIQKLKNASHLFFENDFDIDFTIDFPSIAALSHFERSLMRVYHRFFIAYRARLLAQSLHDKVIITNRSVYDSEAYTGVYKTLSWIQESEFQKLNNVLCCFPREDTVILNPPAETIKNRLQKRAREATRINRDRIFEREDTNIFIECIRAYFEKFQNEQNVLYIEDNGEKEIQKIIEWVRKGREKALLW